MSLLQVKGRFTTIQLCNECGYKCRTVMSMISHIIEKHDNKKEANE